MSAPTERREIRPPLAGVREAPFALRAASPNEPDDGLTLDGFGAVFNSPTTIDSFEGRFREQIANKAMDRSFRETPPKVQFDHGRHPMIGSIPIAQLVSIREDSDPVLAPNGGAHVVARIFDNWLMAPVRDAIQGQAIDGMSFRFEVVREAWASADGKPITDERTLQDLLYRALDAPDDELPVRTLKELKVREIGPVVWPAYADTSVSVRSTIIDLGRLHEPEQRKLLATAVFLADAAESEEEEDAQRDTVPVVEHPSQEAVDEVDKALAPFGLCASDPDAQRDADTAVERPSPPDAQRSTPAVGERPSKPRGRRPIDVMLRRSRDNLLTINHEGKKL